MGAGEAELSHFSFYSIYAVSTLFISSCRFHERLYSLASYDITQSGWMRVVVYGASPLACMVCLFFAMSASEEKLGRGDW